LGYFVTVWHIVCSFGTFLRLWYIFYGFGTFVMVLVHFYGLCTFFTVLVSCTKKNLATLVGSITTIKGKMKGKSSRTLNTEKRKQKSDPDWKGYK
jgi:hypothetical protein